MQRWLKFCKYLPQFDITPVVITVKPEQASYPVTDASFEAEIDSSLEVIRTNSFEPLQLFSKFAGEKKVPYSGFSNVETSGFFSKISRWVRGNFFIPDARKFWNKYAFRAACEVLESCDIDCVITTGPPHSTHLIGSKLKYKYGIKWIADFRDPWTDIYYYNQFLHTNWARRKDATYELNVLTGADHILSVCPSNFEVLSKKADSLSAKMTLISNGFDTDDFSFELKEEASSQFSIAYMGTMAATYNLEPIIKSFSKLSIDWKLVVAGTIAPDIQLLFEKYGLSGRVEMKGYLPHAEALKMIGNAQALLHVVPDVDGARMGTTGKLFEYIGSRVPIINYGHQEGDSAKFIRQANTGRTFSRGDAEGLNQYLIEVQNGMYSGETATDQFSRVNITAKLAKTIDHLTSSDGR